MRLRVGTSGYDFDEWSGSFYPDDLPREKRLTFYSGQFAAVEINNTFYRNPKSDVVREWASRVGGEFEFVLKASKRITHHAPLTNIETLEFLWKSARHLEAHLGPMLFQTSPFFRRDVPRLREFLAALPDGMRAVFEFRNVSWADDEVFAVLQDAGAAWCVSDQPKRPDPNIVATAPFGYLRLHRSDYTREQLEEWGQRVRATEWDDVYVFFKHDLDTAGPSAARNFALAFDARD